MFKNDQNLQHHSELPRRDPKAIFDRLTSIEKEKIFSISYLPTFNFLEPVHSHKRQEPEILNTLRLVYF